MNSRTYCLSIYFNVTVEMAEIYPGDPKEIKLIKTFLRSISGQEELMFDFYKRYVIDLLFGSDSERCSQIAMMIQPGTENENLIAAASKCGKEVEDFIRGVLGADEDHPKTKHPDYQCYYSYLHGFFRPPHITSTFFREVGDEEEETKSLK